MRRINFESDIGKKLASKYFGYEYEDLPFSKEVPVEKIEIIKTKTRDYFEPEIIKENYYAVKEEKIEPKKISDKFFRSNNNKFELSDLVKYFKNEGVVGEEKLVCGITLATINGSSFGVEGYSGSGKTFIADKLVFGLLNNVYVLQQSSDLAIFNDIERVNASERIYFPELNKTMKNKKASIIEVFKDLTEGKDSSRIKTSRNGEGIDEFTIYKNKQIIYTLAIENDFKKDDELSRRIIRFRTDSSEKHLEEIHKNKAINRYNLDFSEIQQNELKTGLKKHINDCAHFKDVKVIDPFSEYMLSIMPVTQKSVGYIDHYYSLLDGLAKFNHNNRQKIKFNDVNYLLLDIEDHFNIYNIYFDEYISSLKDLSKEGEKPNYSRPRWSDCFYSGLNVLNTKKELEPLRQKFPNLIKKWYNSQVVENNIVTNDYITRNQILITKLSEVSKI